MDVGIFPPSNPQWQCLPFVYQMYQSAQRLLSSGASNKYVNHTNTKSAYHTAGFLSDKSASFPMRDAALQSFMWGNKCHKLSAI